VLLFPPRTPLLDVPQVFTQHAYKRALGCNIMLCGCVRWRPCYAMPCWCVHLSVLLDHRSVNDERGAELFKIDCAGHYYGYKVQCLSRDSRRRFVVPSCDVISYQATAAGAKEQEATNNLEKKFKAGPPASLSDALDVAITTLQAVRRNERVSSAGLCVLLCPRWFCAQVLSADFKPDEIEIAVADGDDAFRKLTAAEVEAHLTRIAERD
jgi:20S proteasome subunit alpha 1